MGLFLADVVATSAAVAAAPGRKAKTAALAALLGRAAPDELAPVVRWLSGELTQRQIGVGWATLRDPPAPATVAGAGPDPAATGSDQRTEAVGGEVRADAAGAERRAGAVGGELRADVAGGERRAGAVGGELRADAAGGERRAGAVGGELRADVAGGGELRADVAGGGRRAAAGGGERLTVSGVEAQLAAIGAASGPGSQAAKRDGARTLLAAADPDEQAFLLALLSGGLRQGSLAGLMADAIAAAAEVPAAAVKRALGLDGDLAAVARAALTDGRAGLEAFRIRVGRPLAPMLAATGADVADALARVAAPSAAPAPGTPPTPDPPVSADAPAAVLASKATAPADPPTPGAAPAIAFVDEKLDGARVQVHRDGEDVWLFTRTLDDVTARLPELVAIARALPARSFVLDAEAIALKPDGRPERFQVTASRFGSGKARAVPLALRAFDLLHRDGEDMLDRPLIERDAALRDLVPAEHRIARVRVAGTEDAQAALAQALARGHEGVMVKAPDGRYVAGRRASGWRKVKPVHTFDLVVLGAEWGHGRRRGTLSNLHLGARDGDGFAMVGKTFKGLTDALLAWQTAQLLAREERREGGAVLVRPELVVEIAVDGVQTSRRYASGAALRFARVKRYRPDKTAAQADTLADVLALRDGPPEG